MRLGPESECECAKVLCGGDGGGSIAATRTRNNTEEKNCPDIGQNKLLSGTLINQRDRVQSARRVHEDIE